MLTHHHADFLCGDAVFHMVRATLAPKRPRALHGQDFYTLLWVQNGIIKLHLPEVQRSLREGDMVFLRPSDQQAIQGRGEEPMAVALLFHPGLVAALGQRHGLRDLFWSNAPLPEIRHLDIRALGRLNQAALRLEQAPREMLEAEAFLLPLLTELRDPCPILPDEAPDWLRDICRAARRPEVFRDGAAGLVRHAGRTHPHVSRTMQRFLGCTPSDYINAIRMDFAARALTGTPDSLAEIAAGIGLPNLSHFHKLFRDRHGITPHRYRRTHQRELLQPQLSEDL